MQDFSTSLTSAYQKDAQSAFWALRLYYNDEASFIGISDQDRTLGGDIYYGLANWGGFNMELLLDSFKVREPRMQLSLVNADNTILGGRFSDLLTTKNFIDRKFELITSDGNADWDDTDLLWTGVIGESITHNHTKCDINLHDYGWRQHKEIPLHKVTTALYPAAPKSNIDKPAPIMIGDYSIEAGVPAGSAWERHYTAGHVPAIVVATGDANEDISILPDTDQAGKLHTLHTKNVYLHQDGFFLSCDENNVTLNTSPANSGENLIKFTGIEYYGFILPTSVIASLNDVDVENMTDGDWDTFGQIVFPIEEAGHVTWQFPKMPQMGVIADSDDILILANFDNFSVEEPTPVMQMVLPLNVYGFVWGVGNEYQEATLAAGSWSVNDISAWNFESDGMQLIITATPAVSIDIIMLGVQIKFKPSQTFKKTVKFAIPVGSRWVGPSPYTQLDRTLFEYPSEVEYAYVAGKGREYDSWIDADGRNNGFDAGDLLENPAYIIEEICRAEMELATAEVDYDAFDVSGNTTDGDLENIFGLDAASIKIAFSQYQFENSRDVIERVCKESGQYFWFRHDGKATVRARRRSYTSADRLIDFDHITPQGVYYTNSDNIINDVTVRYNKEYVQDKFTKQRTSDDNANLKDATSQGNTVDGYGNSTGSIERAGTIAVNTNDPNTAEGFGEAYIVYQKDVKKVIEFITVDARYNNLTIGDIINFSGWDANYKAFGSAPASGDGWMITKIQKFPDHCAITATNVPGEIV